MAQGGQQTTGEQFLGSVIGGARVIGSLVKLFGGGKKKVFDPRDIPRLDIVSAREQHDLEIRINKALIEGREPSLADIAELQNVKDFRAAQEKRFQEQQRLFPSFFKNVPLGTKAVDFLRLIGVLRSPTAPTGAPLLPSRTGGPTMPQVIRPSFSGTAGSLDFGGFGGLIRTGLDFASRLISPPQSPLSRFPELQPAGFALPFIGPAARAILPAARALLPVGAGAAGGAIGQGFFDFGGADTLDETAAFTDPVPGSCRPKAHVKVNPCTNKGVWFVPRGKPLVFSGDMAACRRVDRVAKRLDKARPKRRHHHHPR